MAIAPTAMPPGFTVVSSEAGRQLLIAGAKMSVYTFDRDGPLKSNCDERCTHTWTPVTAPAVATSQGDWTVFERSPGVRQWAFRKHPLYTNVLDTEAESQEGSDTPGWHNAYVQKAPTQPAELTTQDTIAGVVVADGKGKTLYTYTCADDSVDQLSCADVDSPQVYRLAICGGGVVERCLRDWPYVVASASAKSISRTWQVLEINPNTGHIASAGEPMLRVWAYQGKPVYTNAHDAPGDIYGNANGEFGASRNGFKALFLRNEYNRN